MFCGFYGIVRDPLFRRLSEAGRVRRHPAILRRAGSVFLQPFDQCHRRRRHAHLGFVDEVDDYITRGLRY